MEKLLIFLLFCGSSVTSGGKATNRDDSGMITIRDVVKVSNNMCNTLARLNTMLKSPAFKTMGVNKLVYNMVTPIPNPTLVVDPTGVMRYLGRIVFNSTRFLDRLARVPNLTRQQAQSSVKDFLEVLNRTREKEIPKCGESLADPKCSEEVMDFLLSDDSANDLFAHLALKRLRKARPSSVFNNPGGAFLTLEEVMRGFEYACFEVKKHEFLFEEDEGFLQIGNTWIPVRDRRYPVSVVRLVDPWGMRRIPGRILEALRNGTRELTDSLRGFAGKLFKRNRSRAVL